MLKQQSPAQDPQALALAALGWVLSDEDRAMRLLDWSLIAFWRPLIWHFAHGHPV